MATSQTEGAIVEWNNQTPTNLQVWVGNIYEEKGGKTLFHVYAGGQLDAGWGERTPVALDVSESPDEAPDSTPPLAHWAATEDHSKYNALFQLLDDGLREDASGVDVGRAWQYHQQHC